jgi:crotonobetainyl-CoA:carnitine CoA-transferase CaiB-like acyl-CoA transferase
MPLPLDGVRVLDLTQVMGGPFCTMMLGDLGADVVKVEPAGTGDLTRRMGGARMRMKGPDNAPFFALNRNKRSVVLDLKNEADIEKFYDLVRAADIVVESFRPGVTEKLGIDYATLSRIRPGLIYGSVSGFGQTGPYAERPGFDLIAQAMSGVMSVTGEPGGKPVKAGLPITDLGAGLFCAVALLAAYIHRERTGDGQHVETSLFETGIALSVWEAAELWTTGEIPQALGSAHRLNAPYQALATSDGHLVVAALTERQWEQLCEVIDRADLVRDARFATNALRMASLPELVEQMEMTLSQGTTHEWVEKFLAAGVPAGPINNYQQVFNDAHTKARQMVEHVEDVVEGQVPTLGFPYKLSATPPRTRRGPPRLGEHTEEVLGEIDWGARPPQPAVTADGDGS